MTTVLRAFHARSLIALVALAGVGCGSDDKHEVQADPDNEGGAPTAAPSYPPALGPEDCATTTSKISLTQPDGAAVWGGLVVLEFTVEGAKVDSFDVQVFDPSLETWTNSYVNTQTFGQREDGSYMMAVSPYFSEVNKDKTLKLRVRPTQAGCPEADWTETTNFSAGDPLVGTKWKAEIPSTGFSGQMNLQRTAVPNEMVIPSTRLTMGNVTLELDFGKKGAFTEIVTAPLVSKKGEPFHGCTISLTFSGTYTVTPGLQYGGVTIAVSEMRVTSTDGSTCSSPKIEDL